MKKSHLLGAVCAIFSIVASSSHAALLTRLGGQAVYDTDLDITFIADTIYSSIDLTAERINEIISNVGTIEGHTLTTDDFVTNGGIIVPTTWWGAKAWADQLVFGGHDDWRLPKTIAPDSNCSDYSSSGKSIGYDCTNSELGHLYYDELGGVGGATLASIGDQTEMGKFSNFLNAIYWTESDAPISPDMAWGFGIDAWVSSNTFTSGLQYQFQKDDTGGATAWAVADGDVFVPLPAAAWLFGSGLLGLIGMARRKNTA